MFSSLFFISHTPSDLSCLSFSPFIFGWGFCYLPFNLFLRAWIFFTVLLTYKNFLSQWPFRGMTRDPEIHSFIIQPPISNNAFSKFGVARHILKYSWASNVSGVEIELKYEIDFYFQCQCGISISRKTKHLLVIWCIKEENN